MKSSGFNLVELSIVLLILAIGLTIALPTLHDRMKRDISRATRDSLTSHLMAARASSIQNGVIIEVCGSGDGSTCSEEWHLGWFSRNDRSQQILARHENTSRTDIHWRGFDKRLRYLPNGTSPTGNGRFFECKDDRIEWQLVLNRQGRLRVAGKSENKSSLTCAPGGERTVSHTVCQSSHSPLRLSLLQGQCALH
ncbi:GspH/FimT family pseudopilin [Pseudomonas aeruginosa]|nr:GspH/FimT family pseudopilin [Pseudomonas aeruginosa]MDF5995097.1 GspH/FimT family pseudopilin [Pseudomonas aeruginosa]MDF6000862.1 GspH/FimT family pseudopilin [Pseudomonas aeruginosa]